MARPIEPTPILRGEDAKRLLRSLETSCSPDEARRRRELADEIVAEMEPAEKRAAFVRDFDPCRPKAT